MQTFRYNILKFSCFCHFCWLCHLGWRMREEKWKVNIQIFTIWNMHACTDRIECNSAKIQRGGFEDMLFWKNSWEFVMLPLLARHSIEFLQNCVAPLPWKFQGQKPGPIEIPHNFPWTPLEFPLFILIEPWNFRILTYALFSFLFTPQPPSGNCKSLPPSPFLWIFISGIAHY